MNGEGELIALRKAAAIAIADVIVRRIPDAPGQGMEDAAAIMLTSATGAEWDGWSPRKERAKVEEALRSLKAADAAMYGVKRAGGSRVGRVRSRPTGGRETPPMSVLG